ncbi:MAG: diacylglycerol kinase family lipid kinase [Bacillota bacterium]|nr:diacylglycerol kinase family lipid kinase [Bacillota bacterium]
MTKEHHDLKKALLIINPSSGGEKAKDYEEQARTKLEAYFEEVIVKYTEKAGDATAYAREACGQGYHSVFVVGGDGTVNEGIAGISEQEHRPIFGFFPLGTVNDLARALSIPLNPAQAIEELDFSSVRNLDVGKINDGYFMNVVAVGAIPEAINRVESKDKTRWGAFAYFASAVKQLLNMQRYHFLIEVDGESREVESSTVLVGLTNSIGGFEKILPNAEVDDGVLHLIYLKDSSMFDSIKAVPNLLGGVEESTDNLEYLTFRKARISLVDDSQSLSVNMDGDEGSALPVEIGILPSHIRVYYGKESVRE